jgi:hypothetical protein
MDFEMRKGRAVCAVAPICGLVALPLAALFETGMLRSYLGPASTIFPIFVGASLTGFLIGAVCRDKDDQEARRSSFDDASTRAGFRAAVLAAAVLVLRATLKAGEPGSVAFPALFVLFVAVVALLPATLLAMGAGGFGAALQSALSGDAQAGRSQFRFLPIHLLYVGCVLAFLSPFIPVLLSPPPAEPIQIAQPVARPKTEPPPPPFRYEKPAELASAAPSRFRVIANKAIAFCSEKQELKILDLDTFTQVGSVRPGSTIAALTWSLDSKRLAVISGQGDQTRIGIVAPPDQRMITLPRPSGTEIPDGGISWPDASEVLLHSQGKPPIALNLDSLEFRPLADARFFNTIDDAKRSRISLTQAAATAKSDRWEYVVAWAVRTAGPEFSGGVYNFDTTGQPGLAARDLKADTRTHLPELALQLQDRVVFAPDGSKVIIVRDASAVVHYIGLRDEAPAVRRLEMKRRAAELPPPAEADRQLAGKSLFGFVYAPLINPLNQRIVGADWMRVKGVVRLIKWTDTAADVAPVEEFAEIHPDDVVSELHLWEKAQAKPVAAYSGTPWWVSIGNQQAATQSPGTDKPVETRIERVLTIERDAYSLLLAGVTLPSPPSVPSQVPAPPAFEQRPEPPPAAVVDDGRRGIPLIDAFIRKHHAKSSNADVQGLMADYAGRVQHYKSGIVSKEFIHAEEMKYHAPGSRIQERVRGEVQIASIGGGFYTATYDLLFVHSKADGSWTRGVATVNLEVWMTPSGPLITKQNSVSQESEKRKGRGVPPSI